MIQEIAFPQYERNVKQVEYKLHYAFVHKYAELNSIKVNITPRTDKVFPTTHVHFSITIDGKQAIIDYSDHEPLAGQYDGIPYFKFHYNEEDHGKFKNIFPIGPALDLPNVNDYRYFFNFIEEEVYTCDSDIILNAQWPRMGALQRRSMVQQMLKANFGSNADTSFRLNDQRGFWERHKNCMVAVCVPGARNNMLDRGHYEQLAMGVCTISPNIRTSLPNFQKLVPGIHYLSCKDDYSDLIDVIEWCRENRKECINIGQNAKILFKENCMPEKYWSWVENCIKLVY